MLVLHVYDVNAWPTNPTNNFKFKNCLFGATSVKKISDKKKKCVCSGYGITFDSASSWSFDNDIAIIMIMLRFEETKVTKENFYATKKLVKIWYVNVDNTVISKLLETKANSEYLTGYLNKVIRPSVLIMPKMRGYVRTSKVKDGDKHKNHKFMSFCIGIRKI